MRSCEKATTAESDNIANRGVQHKGNWQVKQAVQVRPQRQALQVDFKPKKHMGYLQGFPMINSLTRKKAPNDKRYPATMQAPQPIKRSLQVKVGRREHISSSGSSACLSCVVCLVGRRLAKSMLSNMLAVFVNSENFLLCQNLGMWRFRFRETVRLDLDPPLL